MAKTHDEYKTSATVSSNHMMVFYRQVVIMISILTTLVVRLTDWLLNWSTGSLIPSDWIFRWLSDWLTDWPIIWPIIWLTDWQTDLITDRLFNWPTGWLTDEPIDRPTGLLKWPTMWLTYSVIVWLTGWLSLWTLEWLTQWLINWPTIWLTNWLTLSKASMGASLFSNSLTTSRCPNWAAINRGVW